MSDPIAINQQAHDDVCEVLWTEHMDGRGPVYAAELHKRVAERIKQLDPDRPVYQPVEQEAKRVRKA